MVSVAMSSLAATQLHFLEPGVKVNGDYYQNTVLLNMLLPDVCSVFVKCVTFVSETFMRYGSNTTNVSQEILMHSLANLCTKNYENPSIFIKVTAKKSVAPFSCGHNVVIIITFVWYHAVVTELRLTLLRC